MSIVLTPFLVVPGTPPLAWTKWIQLFWNYMVAAGSDALNAERTKAILVYNLGVEGQILFGLLEKAAGMREVPSLSGQTQRTQGDDGSGSQTGRQAYMAPTNVFDDALSLHQERFGIQRNIMGDRHHFRCRKQKPTVTYVEIHPIVTATQTGSNMPVRLDG